MSEAPVKLVGFDNFVRNNPKTDKFTVHKFHHIEFYCGDAANTSGRFKVGLGMSLVAKTDLSTGNLDFCSYVLRSNEVLFAFTAPYSMKTDKKGSTNPLPHFQAELAFDFFKKHGLGVRAVGLIVDDAKEAYETCVANGGEGVVEPVELEDENGKVMLSEVIAYGDVVLRFVSTESYSGDYLPGYETVDDPHKLNFGLKRVDHCVGNVPTLLPQIEYLMKMTGWHEFAEFVSSDIGTENSGLNSMVLANNSEMVLLPINEPTQGTKIKSQIQMFLEHNEGPGLQHIAIKTDDIFKTMRELRRATWMGGFDFMPKPNHIYYENLPNRLQGDDCDLSEEQYAELEELGILGDRDDQGVLLQIFTTPIGDRPTIFVEIIQRIGCMENGFQKGGCGGFGKGNFSELFRSIEEFEIQMESRKKAE
eukprot:CAMPEP_0174260376 /NCGR_PEP_ID=MMETSP0439-20130205/9672_1 /TAXON_ID=0 /ORGANISM="Stereomyxa ramosa, Strain Chinc5" /LENGTH=419 /DNA_ID=CAMNT_0015344607 /DNA_START=8 /DNA_END=1267 /DNA_ORIENTATION=-